MNAGIPYTLLLRIEAIGFQLSASTVPYWSTVKVSIHII